MIGPQVGCTDAICPAASYMSADELHERIFAPHGLAIVKGTIYGSTIRRRGHLCHPQLWTRRSLRHLILGCTSDVGALARATLC
jgi:hypothetical protein